jgi:ABC-2 type transport system permease protein
LQANAMGGVILFAFVAAWVFGREYADRTIKDLMAVPAPRSTIVLAKLSLIAAWLGILSLSVYIAGLGIGAAVQIPGWANDLALAGLARFMLIALLNYLLMPLVALFASIGRGYLPALGWAFTSFVLAQIVSILGWGGWLPWSVPVLWSGMFGAAGAAQVGAHSFLLVFIAFLIGVAATALWWQMADQASQ